jgi:hypothetical protein
MTTPANRFVVGPDPQGRSAVVQRGLTNVQSRERLHWSATLWATEETPVDNTIAGDRSRIPDLGESIQPLPNGLICRALEIEPGAGFPMHHTDTLDCLTCVRGEIHLVTDTDEVHAARRHGDPFSILNSRSVRETHMGRRANKERVIP